MATKSAGELIVARAPLIPIPSARDDVGGLTIGELCEQFLVFKRSSHRQGELSIRSLDRYESICGIVREVFGDAAIVAELQPEDFGTLREKFASGYGPKTLEVRIQCARTLFNFAHKAALIDHLVKYGMSFRKPSARVMRLAKESRGSMMFEADEIRKLIELADPQLRAMILLALNAAFGNADCGGLPFSALNLESGWVEYRRGKTGVARRCPLWPESVAAIRRAIVMRPTPDSAFPEYADLVFLTRVGRCWCVVSECHSPLVIAFGKLKRKARINRACVGFYALRRCFQTVADESLDPVAVSAIMGHIDQSMAGTYRQRISDTRLIAVTECVRSWLFPDEAANYFKQYQVKAAAILARWQQSIEISAADVKAMLKELGVKQYELARGIGLNFDWVNNLLCGRKPISAKTQQMIRVFVRQLADGELPQPMVNHGGFSRPVAAMRRQQARKRHIQEQAAAAIRDALAATNFSYDELGVIAAQLKAAFAVSNLTVAAFLRISVSHFGRLIHEHRGCVPARSVVARMVATLTGKAGV